MGIENINHQENMKTACERLQMMLRCDFVGLAFQEEKGPNINWRVTSGNSNDKFKRITLRYGKGIAGRVISTGRPMEIKYFPTNIMGKALEYPIMLAEKLIYAYAVPLSLNGVPKGVLLIGFRSENFIDIHGKKILAQAAAELEKLMNSLS